MDREEEANDSRRCRRRQVAAALDAACSCLLPWGVGEWVGGVAPTPPRKVSIFPGCNHLISDLELISS
jgi:hypothetical protein